MLLPASWFCCLILAFVSILNVRADAQTTHLGDDLDRYRAQYDLPALAAAVVKNGEIIASGAVGTRMAGTWIPVTIDDRFHLGSNTKALTSLLAGILVEEGALGWDSSMSEMFPELASDMSEGFRLITLQQLLTHLSGLPADSLPTDPASGPEEALIVSSFAQEGNLDDLRYWILGQMCKRPLAAPTRSTFAYSNMGYLLAGAILERAGHKTWEQLITEKVFQPLGLRTAGLGPQATLGRIDAPLGHAVVNGKLKAFLAGPNGDAPGVLGPSDGAHMSIIDFARWAGWNAAEGRRGPDLVRTEMLKKLHAPAISMPLQSPRPPGAAVDSSNDVLLQYAAGWIVARVPQASEPILFNSGTNGMNLAQVWIDPQRDWAMVITTNVFGTQAEAALAALAPELFRRYFH